MFRYPHPRVHPPSDDEMVTKQSSKDECDIHHILAQYQRTGVLTHVKAVEPRFEDLPDSVDYQASMNTLLEADATFRALPSKVRDAFDNDPMTFLSAFNDPARADQLRELGLLKPLDPAPSPPAPSSSASS